jgi:predicted glycosyltransferase
MPQHDYPLSSQMDDPEQREQLMAVRRQVMDKIREIETRAVYREKPDLLLCGTVTGPEIGQRFGIPSVLTFLQPHGPKTLAMFTRFMDDMEQGGLIDSLTAADLILLEGMPEIDGGTSLEIMASNMAGLQDKIHFTGPLLNEYPDELPDREILKEIHCGTRDKTLVYVTIGGGSQLIGEQFIQLVLESFKMLPRYIGVVATGVLLSPDRIKTFDMPVNTIVRGFVPGTELIKASDVTVFHGGSSTLMTCLACGTPAIVVPSMGEQEDNGAVLVQHGAGIMLAKDSLTAQSLAKAIQRIVDNSGFRHEANQLKALGEKYGGAQAAATLAEKVAAGKAVMR